MTVVEVKTRILTFVENADAARLEAVYNAMYLDEKVKFNSQIEEFEEVFIQSDD